VNIFFFSFISKQANLKRTKSSWTTDGVKLEIKSKFSVRQNIYQH